MVFRLIAYTVFFCLIFHLTLAMFLYYLLSLCLINTSAFDSFSHVSVKPITSNEKSKVSNSIFKSVKFASKLLQLICMIDKSLDLCTLSINCCNV